MYEAEEIAAMLKHATQNEALFLKFLLASGFRDREVRYVAWRDIDFRNSLVRVTAKPLWHWRFITRRCQGSETREQKSGLARIPLDIQGK